MLNYPLKFTPILKQKIWGGNKLKDVLHKPCDTEKWGESWEISGVEGTQSVVANGAFKGRTLQRILDQYEARLVGVKVHRRFQNQFPLLIKFIDAGAELSVQVHPDDILAGKRHQGYGKAEMWYIMQADPMARINIGFNRSISKEEYLHHLREGRLVELLHFEKVKAGDSFYIQPGTVHAIGRGILLAEIQQPSDITYRIYDWDRKDEKGDSRELHTELALDAIDFKKPADYRLSYSREENQASTLYRSAYFTTQFLPVKGSITRSISALDSFVIYMCIGGKAEVSLEGNTEEIRYGECLLIPAENKEVRIVSPDVSLLEIFIDS